jgi:predicted nucleotidyltransferase
MIVTMINPNVALPSREQLESICKRHHIRRLSIFGSALGEEFTPESDVDILVEFDEGHTPGFSFISIAEELSGVFGRSIDLNTPRSIHRRYRDRVLRESELLYAA